MSDKFIELLYRNSLDIIAKFATSNVGITPVLTSPRVFNLCYCELSCSIFRTYSLRRALTANYKRLTDHKLPCTLFDSKKLTVSYIAGLYK